MTANANNQDWATEATATLAPLSTAKEVATFLRCSTRNLRRMIGDGRLRAFKSRETGSSAVLVPRASIEAYLRSRVQL